MFKIEIETTTILKEKNKHFICTNEHCRETVNVPQIDDFTSKKFVIEIKVKYCCPKCGRAYWVTFEGRPKAIVVK